ncbi:MAG: porin [Candidatus Accumulibacter sp.]|nr:porin [Accumulibacter sp.]
MQKKIIALAVAGLVSGAAFAQSNVTLYGRLDLGYVYSKSDYKKFQGIENGNGINGGGSRIGVKGEEALGNGLKAIFEAEWGFAADEGSGPVDARWAFVGLAGKFGRVTVGRNNTPDDLYLGATGVMGVNGHEPIRRFRDQANTGTGNAGGILVGDRWNNSIAYNSPNFSGIDFTAIYSFGEKVNTSKGGLDDNDDPVPGYSCTGSGTASVTCYKGADTSDAGKFGLGVRYANGPLYLTAVYEARADDDSAKEWPGDGNEGYGAKGWALGGTYDFKVAKVYANYYRVKQNDHGRGGDEGSDKRTAWSLGVGVPVSGAGTIVAEYAQFKDSFVDDGNKAKGYTVGYKHTLSKRTSLYTYLVRINNDDNVSAGWTKTGITGENQTTFTAGILHVF